MNTVMLYASLLAVLFVILSVRTIRLRRALKIGVGDSGNPQMLRAIRAHANFAEYVPFSLLLIFCVQEAGANLLFVHLLGASLLLGRGLHAFGFSQAKENFKYRISGMLLTFSVLLICSAYLLIFYFLTYFFS